MAEETIVAICQFGGGFVFDGGRTMSYTGGEAHALDISRGMKLHDFKSEISDIFKIDCNTISINCFNSKQCLIKISSDKDLEQMVDSNINPGAIDIYISIEADNRTRVADSGTSIAEASANVETPDSRKTSKRKTRTSVSPSVKPLEPGGRGRGRGNTGKTTKRVTRPSVSPVEAMKSGGRGATAGRNTGNTSKRVTRSNVSPLVEAMEPGDIVAAADPGGSTEKTETKKRKTRSRVSPSVKTMKGEGRGTGSDTGQSTENTNKRVTRSSVSPSAEAMKPGNGGANSDAGQSMAEKLLCAAEKLISAENLAGSKKLALDALEYDPLVEGADQIIAVTDVLLAAQRRINNQVDWYAVLQLDPDTSGRDPHMVRQHYRRLTLLLRPGRSPLPAAADASRIVADAWAVLSDPSKKSLHDAELNSATDPPSVSGPSELVGPTVATDPTFWTTCSFCFHMHQYFRAYEGRCLQCQNCRHVFVAAALTAVPPVVPGTDMYYCSWGFFPLGFAGGTQVGNTSLHAMPLPPSLMNLGNLGGLLSQTDMDKGNALGSEKTVLPKKPPPISKRKTAVKKATRNNSKKRVFFVDSETVRPAASAVVVDPETKSRAVRSVTVGSENRAAVVVEPEAKSGASWPATVGPEDSAATIAESGAKSGAEASLTSGGPENRVATIAEPEAKSGSAISTEIVVERGARSGAARPVGPKSRARRPVGAETSVAVVAEAETKSGAVRAAAVRPEKSVAAVTDSEVKSGTVRQVGPENSAAVAAEPKTKTTRGAASPVVVRPENSAALVVEPEAKSGSARSIAVGLKNSAANIVEPAGFELEHCDAVVVAELEAKSAAGRQVAIGLEHYVAAAAAIATPSKAPLVLDLNEEAGFWEAQDTGLMMDQDEDNDLGSFDFDLDAVDLEAVGDLLGQFN